MKKRLELLDLLRLAAILLVINSHLDELYPIPALATGGAAGNGLFFIISGYCLRLQPGFFRHMGRRFARLYPGVFLSLLVQMAFGLKAMQGVKEMAQNFLWPTAFWFVGAIVLFDALLWVLEKGNVTERFRLFSAGMLALYIVAYIFVVDKSKWSVEAPGLTNAAQCFKLIYCFYMYCLGFYLQKTGVPERVKAKQGKLLFLSGLMFLLPMALKAVMVKWPGLMPLQGLTQFMVIAFAYAALLLALTGEEIYRAKVPQGLRKWISAGAVLSLEMYLVQFPVIGLCKALPFPVNVGVVLIATTALAFLLNRADQAIYRFVDRFIKKA